MNIPNINFNDNNGNNRTICSNNNFNNQKSTVSDINMTYNFLLPNNADIFSNISSYSDLINDFANKEEINKFLYIFKQEMIKYYAIQPFTNQLNKINVIKLDESIMIQWNYRHFRIFFSFERKLEESNYGIVADNLVNGEYFSQAGALKKENYQNIISEIILFVLNKT